MAIAYVTSGGQYTASSATSTVSVAAGASGYKAIILCTWGNGADLVGVTVGGNAATKIRSFNMFGAQWMGAWYYDNPPSGATNYVATATSAADDVEICVLIYSGAATGAVDSSAQNTATGNLASATTVVATGCWLASSGRNQTFGPATAGTGTTSRQGLSLSRYGDSNGTVGTGSQSMGWNAASGTTASVIVSIAPASTTAVKTAEGLAIASVKTGEGLATASVKTWEGLA